MGRVKVGGIIAMIIALILTGGYFPQSAFAGSDVIRSQTHVDVLSMDHSRCNINDSDDGWNPHRDGWYKDGGDTDYVMYFYVPQMKRIDAICIANREMLNYINRYHNGEAGSDVIWEDEDYQLFRVKFGFSWSRRRWVESIARGNVYINLKYDNYPR